MAECFLSGAASHLDIGRVQKLRYNDNAYDIKKYNRNDYVWSSSPQMA